MKVRPPGWGFLFGLCICADAFQILLNLMGGAAALSGVGIVVSFILWGLAGIATIFVRVILFIWHDHHDLPSNFGHMLFTTIGEMIPMVNIIPFWTLYAFTYWVEEEAELPEDGPLYGRGYFPDNESTE